MHSFLYLISWGLFMTFNFLGPGLTVNVEAKVKEQIILDSSDKKDKKSVSKASSRFCCVATNLEFVLKFERIPFNATEVLILKNDE